MFDLTRKFPALPHGSSHHIAFSYSGSHYQLVSYPPELNDILKTAPMEALAKGDFPHDPGVYYATLHYNPQSDGRPFAIRDITPAPSRRVYKVMTPPGELPSEL